MNKKLMARSFSSAQSLFESEEDFNKQLDCFDSLFEGIKTEKDAVLAVSQFRAETLRAIQINTIFAEAAGHRAISNLKNGDES